jgi:hypothetical protein
MSDRAEELFKTVMQVLAVLALLLIFGMLAHKGYADISRLAREHPGSGFWDALARYVFKNMAGG